MNWKPFTPDIPERGKMLFLDEQKHWFEGTLTDDSEYGLCIAFPYETYTSLKGITHYMIVELPLPVGIMQQIPKGKYQSVDITEIKL
jgi:hypothetical protein